MRKFGLIVAALLALAQVSSVSAYDVQRVPLAVSFDLDGLGVDVDYNVLATQATDSKVDYTISAQNEVCRVNNVVVVDADSSITVGVATITGTDCWGDPLVCSTNITGGSGAKTLAKVSGTASTCAFKTITQVETGVLTGESGAADTISVGYPALSGYVYPIYGTRQSNSNGQRYVDPFRIARAAGTAKINGTAITSYATADGGAFQNMSIGDLVYITYGGKTFERKLVNVASDDAATLDSALPTAVAPAITTEVALGFKKLFIFREAQDAWVPVSGGESVFAVVDVDANVNTGGVISSVECSVFNSFSSDPFDPTIQVDTDTVASAGTGTNTTSIDLRLAAFSHCRVGLQFGTGDDADGANEDINVILAVSKESN